MVVVGHILQVHLRQFPSGSFRVSIGREPNFAFLKMQCGFCFTSDPHVIFQTRLLPWPQKKVVKIGQLSSCGPPKVRLTEPANNDLISIASAGELS